MRLLTMGMDEAVRLGQHWMGPEHTLLGILRGDPDDVARRALEEAGVDGAMVEERIARMDSGDREVPTGVGTNPAWHRIFGRAEGIAAGLGDVEVETVHFLLAMLWDSRRSILSERRDAVVAALTKLGATVPPAPLPALERNIVLTQTVELPSEDSDRVLRLLAERHPPGSGPAFGFNYRDAGTASVSAEDGIDLDAIVREALARRPDG